MQEIIYRSSALIVRRKLPASITSCMHHGKQFGGRDKELATVVRIGFSVELLSERTVRIALKCRSDGHAAVERQLESSELQPGIARVGCVWRRFDLLFQCGSGLRCIRPPREYRANGKPACGFQFLIPRDLFGVDGAVPDLRQT